MSKKLDLDSAIASVVASAWVDAMSKGDALPFAPPWMKGVTTVDSSRLDKLPYEEQAAILKSVNEATGRLALKNIGYNRSVGHNGKAGFDVVEYSLRAFRELRFIKKLIASAVERNDWDYFIALGRKLAKLRKRPTSPDQELHGDPLGYWLAVNWTNDGHDSPALCLLSPQVLHEVCKRCVKNGKVTPKQLEIAVQRLGLKRPSRPVITRAAHSADEGLCVAADIRAFSKLGLTLIC